MSAAKRRIKRKIKMLVRMDATCYRMPLLRGMEFFEVAIKPAGAWLKKRGHKQKAVDALVIARSHP